MTPEPVTFENYPPLDIYGHTHTHKHAYIEGLGARVKVDIEYPALTDVRCSM